MVARDSGNDVQYQQATILSDCGHIGPIAGKIQSRILFQISSIPCDSPFYLVS